MQGLYAQLTGEDIYICIYIIYNIYIYIYIYIYKKCSGMQGLHV